MSHNLCRSCLPWLVDPRTWHDQAQHTQPLLHLLLQAVNFFTFEVYRQALSGIYGPDAWMLRYVAGACAGGHSMLLAIPLPASACHASRTLQPACQCNPLQPVSHTPAQQLALHPLHIPAQDILMRKHMP